ncbi:hypothetical protein BLA29_015381, partial [Euroglyphus maynei]
MVMKCHAKIDDNNDNDEWAIFTKYDDFMENMEKFFMIDRDEEYRLENVDRDKCICFVPEP